MFESAVFLHLQVLGVGAGAMCWEWGYCNSLEPRLSVLDFVTELWSKTIFLQSCKTKSGTESLGSRLLQGIGPVGPVWAGLSLVGVVICYRPAQCVHLEQLQNVEQMQQVSESSNARLKPRLEGKQRSIDHHGQQYCRSYEAQSATYRLAVSQKVLRKDQDSASQTGLVRGVLTLRWGHYRYFNVWQWQS